MEWNRPLIKSHVEYVKLEINVQVECRFSVLLQNILHKDLLHVVYVNQGFNVQFQVLLKLQWELLHVQIIKSVLKGLPHKELIVMQENIVHKVSLIKIVYLEVIVLQDRVLVH